MPFSLPRELMDWVPSGADLTSGLVIQQGGCFLFALEPSEHWAGGSPPHIRFVGIGGHREPGETWAQAVQREAQSVTSME
ncbi:MAG: NUDIX hydrolase [Anaerolineae bacterium]